MLLKYFSSELNQLINVKSTTSLQIANMNTVSFKEPAVVKLGLKSKVQNSGKAFIAAITVTLILFTSVPRFVNAQLGSSSKPTNQVFLSHGEQKNLETNSPSTGAPPMNFIDSFQKSIDNASSTEISSITMNPIELANLRSKLEDQIFVSKKGEKELLWPSFPRIWTERSLIEQRTINLGNTVSINPFSVGLKLKRALSNQYSLKTTFVLISSDKPNDPKIYESNGGQYPIVRNIFKMGSDHLVYPNIEANFPIVGFCSFEAKYTNETQVQTGVSVLTFNLDQENINSEPVSYYVTSKLFQVSDKISIKHYLRSVCGQIFKQKIEQKVIEDFAKIKHEMEFQLNLDALNLEDGLCQPATVSDALQTEESDDSCNTWHETKFSSMITARTIARCKYDDHKKNYYCVLRSKENRTCPIYWDSKSKSYETNLAKTRKSAISATSGYYEFPCDTENGFQCKFTDNPIFLFNVPFISGRGVCTRVSK